MKISEIFFSIQGEGIHIGLPTVFLRLFGCDLRCVWCDTMYAVEGTDFEEMETAQTLKRLLRYNCPRVCITGGEPLVQLTAVEEITDLLLTRGFEVVLETSGNRKPPEIFSHPNSIVSMDCKCPGSGMHKKIDLSFFEFLEEKDQLKFVIADQKDYEYAKQVLSERAVEASIIFQPVYGTTADWIAENVLRDGLKNIRVLPQLHKIFWGEGKGV